MFKKFIILLIGLFPFPDDSYHRDEDYEGFMRSVIANDSERNEDLL